MECGIGILLHCVLCYIFMTIQAHLMTVGVISAQKKMLSVLTA